MPEIDIFEARFAATYRRYLDEVPTEVDAADVARTVAVAGRRSRVGTFSWSPAARQAVGWVLLLALVLLTAVGAALLVVGAPRPAQRGVTLVPTGIDVITPDTGSYGRAVVDANGAIWARGDGRLVRFDPATDTAREWTVSDDDAFGMSEIAVAGGGGVWLVEARRCAGSTGRFSRGCPMRRRSSRSRRRPPTGACGPPRRTA